MLEKIVALSSVIAVVCVIALLQVTNPATAGPLGIFALFVLMYVSVLGILTFLLFSINKITRRIISFLGIKRSIQELSFKKAYYFSSVLALAPVMLIGLQSVGEVGIYELLLVAVFMTIACAYVAKRTS